MTETKWFACTNPEEMLRALPADSDRRRLRLFGCACCRRLTNLLRDPASQEALAAIEKRPEATGTHPARELAEAGLATVREANQTAERSHAEAQERRATTWEAIWGTTPPSSWQILQVAAEEGAARAALSELQAAESAALAVFSLTEALFDVRSVADEAMRARARFRVAMALRERASRWKVRADAEAERPIPRSRAAVRASQAMQWIEDSEDGPDGDEEYRIESRSDRDEQAAQCAILHDIFDALWHPVAIEPSWRRWRGGILAQMAQGIHDARRFDELPILADALEEAGCTDHSILQHARRGGPHVLGCWLLDALLDPRG